MNSDFSSGSDNTPRNWHAYGWRVSDPKKILRWIAPTAGKSGEVELSNDYPNDAAWLQVLLLGAGWHHLSAEARTENVGSGTGASVSVLEEGNWIDGIKSRKIAGTSDWQPIDLYLKVGARGTDLEFALRLGSHAQPAAGRAFFRNPRAVRVETPPPGAWPCYDLERILATAIPRPSGRPWTLVAAFALLASIAVAGWRLLA